MRISWVTSLGVVGIENHFQGDVVYPCLVPVDQALKRDCIAFQHLLYYSAVAVFFIIFFNKGI